MNPQTAPLTWQCAGRALDLARVAIMGILNVTPDSFSDGGVYGDAATAVAAGLRLVADGADILDIGGESTRPGATPVPAEEELRRVLPVIESLRAQSDVLISIDTTKAEVARAALSAGAQIINDVSAATADAEMLEVARTSGAGLVLMHMRGTPQTMLRDAVYDDVVAEVRLYLSQRLAAVTAAGLDPLRVVLDPGIGFAKEFEHDVTLFRRLRELTTLPRPLLMAASRKRFLGRITGADAGDRDVETAAAMALAVQAGARIVRVHNVGLVRRAVRVAEALGDCASQ
jgi:dihydropteroate synthase